MVLPLCKESYYSVYFALDRSTSMDTGSPSRMAILKESMSSIINDLQDVLNAGGRLDVAINFWGSGSSQQSKIAATVDDLEDLRSFVNGISTSGGTDFTTAINPAVTWFTDSLSTPAITKRIFILLTDGAPNPAGSDDTAAATASDMLDPNSGSFNTADGTAIEMYGFNIELVDTTHTAKLDNTPSDGVPVITSLEATEFLNVISPVLECILPGTGYAVFFRLDTSPEPLRLWCGINDVSIGIPVVDEAGAVYLGAGKLLDVPELEVLINGVADNVDISLPGVSVEASNRIAAEAPDIQGLAVNIGLAYLDERYQPLTNIIPVWFGRADIWTLDQPPTENPEQQPTRTLILSVASGMTARVRPRRSSYTDAQQKLLYPTDDFCNRVSRYTERFTLEWPIF